jgi:hypothetical protein
MEEIEARLRRDLSRSTLVYLAFPNEDHDLETLMARLRHVGARLGTIPGSARTAYLRENLATYLVGVTYAAWDNYSEGTLWPYVEEALGHPTLTQQELADFYRLGLDAYGLDRFQVSEMRNVSEILVHSGIPRKSQSTFLDRLVRAFQKEDNLSAEEFNLRVSNLARSEVAAKGFDIPTWRFISRAPDIAEDLTEKCLEVLDDIAEDGEWDQGGGEGLPSPLLAAIVDKAKEIQLTRKARRRGNSLRMVPAVWLDPSTLEIKLLLPQYEQLLSKPVTWKVNDGSEISNLSAYPELRGLELRPKEVIVERLTREITISCAEYGEPWDISLFDPDSPISFFRLDGRALPDSGPLPGQEVLVLGPISGGSEGFQLALNGQVANSFVDNGPPTGWSDDPESHGWRILRLDLTGVSRVSLFQNGTELVDSIRYVGQGAPSFVLDGHLVPSVESEGQPVFSAIPSVMLPAVDGGSDSAWTIRVRFDSNKSVFASSVPFSNAPSVHAINAPMVEGPFTISVEGKRGNTQRLQGFLVSGLRATFSPPLRTLKSAGDGLEQCRYLLEQHGKKVSQGVLDGEVEVGIRTPGGSDLKVRPQHVEIQLRQGSEVTRHLKAVSFDPEELLDSRLYLVWPSQKLERAAAKAGSIEAQALSIKGRDTNAPFLVLGEVADTARAFGRLDIIATHSGNETRVATVKVDQIVSDVSINNQGWISYNSAVDSSSLRLRGYCLDAPWAEPFEVQLSDSGAQLPEKLFGFGDIGLAFEVYDPWVQTSWPESFIASSNSAVLNTAHLQDDGSPEANLARWFQDSVFRDALHSLPSELFARLLIDDSMCTQKRGRDEVIALAKILSGGFKATLLPELAKQTIALKSSALDVLFSLDLIDKVASSDSENLRVSSAAPFLSLMAMGDSKRADLELLRTIGIQLFGFEVAAADVNSGLKELGILNRSELFEDFVKQVLDLDFLGDPDARRIAKERLGVVPSQPMHRTQLAGIFLDLLAKRGNLEKDPLIRIYLDQDKFREFSKTIRRALPASAVWERSLLMAATRPDSALAGMGGNISFIMGLSTALAVLARQGARNQNVISEYLLLKELHKRLFELMPALVEYDLVVAELLASFNVDSNGGI